MRSLIVLLFASLLVFSACNSANRKASAGDIENHSSPDNPNPKGPKGTPTFESTTHNFGDIVDGEQVQHKYTFKNTGKGDLVISSVHATCGCTTPEWTRDIIPPGGEGFIMATFNSTNREGMNEKHVEVEFSSSTVDKVSLEFKANVLKK